MDADQTRAVLQRIAEVNDAIAEAHRRALARQRILRADDPDPVPSTEEMDDAIAHARAAQALLANRDELRAVLAPLLDEPLIEDRCRCCRRTILEWSRRHERFLMLESGHAPDCPVLRRDALLGRT